MADTIYHNFFLEIMSKLMNCASGGDTFKLALYTDSYEIDPDETTYGTTNEVAGENGYTQGGYAFTNTNNSVTDNDEDNWTIFDIGEDAAWAEATITARYAKLYSATDGNKLACAFDFGSNKSSTAGTFKVVFNANGIIKLS